MNIVMPTFDWTDFFCMSHEVVYWYQESPSFHSQLLQSRCSFYDFTFR